MRSVTKGSLIGATVAVLALVLIGPASAVGSITVSPDTGLVDGQEVNISGSGFAAGDTIVMHECAKVGDAPLECDYRTKAIASANGSFFNVKFVVHPFVGGQTCVDADPCFLRVKDAHGNVDKHKIYFGSTSTTKPTTTTTTNPGSSTTTTRPPSSTTSTTRPPSTSPCANPTIVGTAAGEVLQGTEGPDIINARGGADFVDGKGGNDVICGGDGDDVIQGGDGNDRIYGQAGSDTLDGEDGTDACDGGIGSDFGSDCESQKNIP
jgi:Neocarzinostatin family/RTX calcium-binding nonapeptide repeat (4 copies)